MKQLAWKNRLDEWRARWAGLSASEQRAVKWCVGIVSPLLFYAMLWQPAHTGVARLQQSVPQLRAQYAQVQAQAVEIQTLRQRAQPAALEGDALKRIVESAAAATGLVFPVMTVELAEKNEVRIRTENIEFVRWLRFLRELENTHHIRVSSLTTSATPTQGMVKISAVLNNGAGQ